MPRKLKVFRTSAGFSDAYVAVPSQKAALAAWGSDVNLFARGMAEEVTDPALTAEPLKKPGEVLTVSRGDLAAHLKALKGSGPPKKSTAGEPVKMRPAARKKPPARKRPPPARDKLGAAESALREAEDSQREKLRELERQRDAAEQALERHKKKMDRELAALRAKRDREQDEYQDALDRWSG